jgi:hypothetical protein
MVIVTFSYILLLVSSVQFCLDVFWNRLALNTLLFWNMPVFLGIIQKTVYSSIESWNITRSQKYPCQVFRHYSKILLENRCKNFIYFGFLSGIYRISSSLYTLLLSRNRIVPVNGLNKFFDLWVSFLLHNFSLQRTNIFQEFLLSMLRVLQYQYLQIRLLSFQHTLVTFLDLIIIYLIIDIWQYLKPRLPVQNFITPLCLSWL